MTAEVANNQAAAAVSATEENITEKKLEDVALATKDENKSSDDADVKSSNESHPEPAASTPVTSQAKCVPAKVLVHKTDFEKDVIYLYQFSRTPFLPSISPYCLKVETWLRLAGLKYEVRP